jgi:hypothetical protein
MHCARHRCRHSAGISYFQVSTKQRRSADFLKSKPLLGFAYNDTQQTKLNKLDALLAQSSTSPWMRLSLLKCCHYPTMVAIRRSNAATTAENARCANLTIESAITIQSGADDF